MAILLWIVFGLVIGIIAKLLMPGRDPGGFIVTILLGIAGALVGGFVGRATGFYGPGQAAGWLMSILGAIILLALYRMLVRSPGLTRGQSIGRRTAASAVRASSCVQPISCENRSASSAVRRSVLHASPVLSGRWVRVRPLADCQRRARTDGRRDHRLEPESKGGIEKNQGDADGSHERIGRCADATGTGHDVHGTMTMVAKRPNLMRRDAVMRRDGDLDDRRIVNAFDGTSLWMSIGAPVGAGAMAPQKLPNSQSAYARQDAEFDSVFVDYKEKGTTIELIGKDTVADTPVYHLKVTKKGGPPQNYYLDATTGLEKRISVSAQSPTGGPLRQYDGLLRLSKRGRLYGSVHDPAAGEPKNRGDDDA